MKLDTMGQYFIREYYDHTGGRVGEVETVDHIL